ncbi:hypothetical protein GCM10027521_28020 [Amycolatopsis cihanbeyliensis]
MFRLAVPLVGHTLQTKPAVPAEPGRTGRRCPGMAPADRRQDRAWHRCAATRLADDPVWPVAPCAVDVFAMRI